MSDISRDGLEEWITSLMECKPLTEAQVKQLCDKVSIELVHFPSPHQPPAPAWRPLLSSARNGTRTCPAVISSLKNACYAAYVCTWRDPTVLAGSGGADRGVERPARSNPGDHLR